MPSQPLRLGAGGRFELRPAEYRLLVDGQPASLGGRALDLLFALATRPGQLWTKNALLDAVWPGLVVEENNLRVQINTLRRLLGEDAIATVPGRGYRLSAPPYVEPAAVQPQVEAAQSTLATPPTLAAPGQPAPAAHPRLFGRGADLAQLEAALQQPAGTCLTLVGMPGVGKSSLARVAMARWAGRRAWVDLAPLTQGAQVAGAIGRALSLQFDEADALPALQRAIGSEPWLLVLDNAEHLVEACAGWAGRLAAIAPLRLLVTSQLPLGVAGEQLQRLAPLSVGEVPDWQDAALALLVERIAAADNRYAVPPAALPLLAALCRQLDGLPLALEMAAARVPLMGLQGVHDALAERFALLSRGRRDSPARHRTLHAALDWSYQLLGEAEQRLFRALGVFAGGFTLELAITLTADEHIGRWDVVDGLASLVERSLVTVSGTEPPRYRLLETMRAYALARLAAPAHAGEAPSLRRRHAAAVLGLLAGDDAEQACLAEMENAREAFHWAREHDLALAAQLSGRVVPVIGFTIWRQEVTEWMLALQPQMQQPAAQALPAELQAHWWAMLAYVLNVRRSPAARPAAERAVALWRPLGQPKRLLSALCHWVRAISAAGPELEAACAELMQTAEALGTPVEQLHAQGALAEAARLREDLGMLLACREQELRLSRELGWADMAQAAESNVCAALVSLGRHGEAAERAAALLVQVDADDGERNGNLPWVLNGLLESLAMLGRLDEAQALVPRSLAAGQRFGTTVAWQGILALQQAQGRLEAAARLAGHLGELWNRRGATPDRDEQARHAHCLAAAQAAFGADRATGLVAEGRRLDEAAAAALAAAPFVR